MNSQLNNNLISAVLTNDLFSVNELILFGADIHVINHNGNNLLHLACQKDYLDIAQFLITKGVDINAKDYVGQTPLTMACIGGHDSLVKILINCKANILLFDLLGYSTFQYVCFALTSKNYNNSYLPDEKKEKFKNIFDILIKHPQYRQLSELILLSKRTFENI